MNDFTKPDLMKLHRCLEEYVRWCPRAEIKKMEVLKDKRQAMMDNYRGHEDIKVLDNSGMYWKTYCRICKLFYNPLTKEWYKDE